MFIQLSCSSEINKPYPCLDGNCEAIFKIDPLVSPGVYQDNNGYWHIEHIGLNYFTIKGDLDELHPDYVINGVPLIEVGYDSNYWVAFDSITFTVPMYSFLSWFSDGEFNNPIPIGNFTFTLTDIAQIQPPLNIAGYQISPNMCWDCPYTESLLGTYSKNNYHPRQQFFFDNEMAGDTARVFIKTLFNSDVGPRIEVEHEFKIIFEDEN
ncbi:hypothetical protein JYT76_03240 [Olleya sp. AH-315-F22]|nr:hypothetical protein [Olleya sp. AH-315-F22]